MIDVRLEICCVFAEQNMRWLILLVFPRRISEHKNFFYQWQILFPLQLLDARQLIDKNHIVIERDKVDKVKNQHINFTFANFSYSRWRRWHFSKNNATFFDLTGMITLENYHISFFRVQQNAVQFPWSVHQHQPQQWTREGSALWNRSNVLEPCIFSWY